MPIEIFRFWRDTYLAGGCGTAGGRAPCRSRPIAKEFLDRVSGELAFELQESEEDLVQKVLQALRRHISDGEWEDVKSAMPKDLTSILP
ncbi:DUF2267 domain-containing protein [Nonomuraea sp. NPDC004580]|uniref:DUF2267 domain-containing protein n=1 Tax=Nonomuraea sp. NPDC004580 TaxID=3154552 RepID=UPI0033BF5A77